MNKNLLFVIQEDNLIFLLFPIISDCLLGDVLGADHAPTEADTQRLLKNWLYTVIYNVSLIANSYAYYIVNIPITNTIIYRISFETHSELVFKAVNYSPKPKIVDLKIDSHLMLFMNKYLCFSTFNLNLCHHEYKIRPYYVFLTFIRVIFYL
uniref:Uncharacterized protein n=1 Tax=Heterorhabditis bacteriophora TaxID=37862 RepID=A0A1I7WYL1_HETBA